MSPDQETAMVATAPTNDAASARKRRKAIIQSQRSEAVVVEHQQQQQAQPPPQPPVDTTEDAPSGVDDDEPPSKKSKTTQQILEDEESARSKQARKYVPDVPMGKEQLAAWRREARRVRNRESAAASRQRIRERITVLEEECEEWKRKYQTAMERLRTLEQQKQQNGTDPDPQQQNKTRSS
ncbi:expressed unknown protein [Seminavis robusta]|uniref:BZIP domain-containing protein n=1 Tax=Seminavis robusta TaxID=568900 RepID=A0A9N8EFW6_9STRA|nr:expressed unknown protein [Seminavis robusta]|eukprot:Sro1035_g233890.1 n/a (181) ;mRNA; r:8549-9091